MLSDRTVRDLDPVRYSGTWYEIGRYPMPWENDCDRAVAIYTPNDTGIFVENQCYHKGKTCEI